MARQKIERSSRGEARQEDVRAGNLGDRERRPRIGEMEHRRDVRPPIAGVQRELEHCRMRVGADVAVRQHDALGPTGRAARVVEVRDGVGIGARHRCGCELWRLTQQRFDRQRRRCLPRRERSCQRRELGFEQQRLAFCMLHDSCHLGVAESPVERDEDRAESRRGEVGDEMRWRVCAQTREPIAVADTARVELGGESLDQLQRFLVGDDLVIGDERWGTRSDCGCVRKQREQVHEASCSGSRRLAASGIPTRRPCCRSCATSSAGFCSRCIASIARRRASSSTRSRVPSPRRRSIWGCSAVC